MVSFVYVNSAHRLALSITQHLATVLMNEGTDEVRFSDVGIPLCFAVLTPQGPPLNFILKLPQIPTYYFLGQGIPPESLLPQRCQTVIWRPSDNALLPEILLSPLLFQ